MSEAIFPTLKEVYEFHELQIELFGGSQGVRDTGLVESALYAAQQTFDGIELYPTIPEKAAALWHGFVCNHAFIDGNKRIGLMVVEVFLSINGFDLDYSSQEAEDITLKLASSQMSRQELMRLIVSHVVPL